MSLFTASELQFLAKYHFSEDEVYDGRRQGKRSRESAAREAGLVLILTSSPCREQGHRIRTRAGHCAQCKPMNIAFTSRERASAHVYIAGSLAGQVIKIGVAGDVIRRQKQLCAEGYGGFSDWTVLICVEVDDAGAIERQVASKINGRRINNHYFKDGVSQMATEVIQCSFSAAFKALSDSVGGIGLKSHWLKRNRDYEFSTTD